MACSQNRKKQAWPEQGQYVAREGAEKLGSSPIPLGLLKKLDFILGAVRSHGRALTKGETVQFQVSKELFEGESGRRQ